MKKMNLGIRFILGFVSVILCILLVVATLATAILGDLNVVFQKDNLQNLLTEALFTSATARRPAPVISGNGHGAPAIQRFPARLDEFDLTTGSEGDTSAMVEWIYGTLTDQFGEENLPSLEVVQDFVEESTVTDFLTDKTASIISDVITGSNNTTITTEEIQTLLEDNAQLIEDTFGFEMDEEVITQVITVVEENEVVKAIQEEGVTSVVQQMVDSGALDLPPEILPMPEGSLDSSDSTATNPMMDLIKTIQSVVSVSTLLITIGVCVVLIALQLVTNIKRIWIGINNTGISLTVAGSILMIPTCLLWFAADLLMELLKDAGPVGKIVLYVLKSTAPIHIGIFAGGIVLIVGGCVLRTILKKKAKAAAEAAAIEETVVAEAESEDPTAEEVPAEEEAAEEVEAPVEEEVPAQEETPAEEEAPAAEEVPAEEEAPAEPV